jgi:hypothetical protein
MEILVALICISFVTFSNAFLSIGKKVQQNRSLISFHHGGPKFPSTHCHHMTNSDGNDVNNVEDARRRLESLVSTTQSEYTEKEIEMNDLPLLSTIARERREVEIELLQSLEHNDQEAVENLWNLWYSERGPKAHSELLDIEQTLFSDPSRWPRAEARLNAMMDEYDLHFCEPVNRLATLYFMQGRYEESKTLCEIVLKQKPWHFGALSGIVMVCVGLQDHAGARKWAARRLPPLVPDGTTDNRRRVEWTKRAVEDSKRALREEEDRFRKSFGGRQNLQYEQPIQQHQQQEQKQQPHDEDSWQ